MKIISDYNNCPKNALNCAIALGNFDGVHKGHCKIIKRTIEIANKNNIPSAIMTFEPHPISVFKKKSENFRITDKDKKSEILRDLGIDYIFNVKFDNKFAQIKAENFIQNILLDKLNARHIVIGYDFIFGHKRQGNAKLLRKMSQDLGYDFTQIDAIGENDEIFSSTKVRNYLLSGDLERASYILGRNFSVSGTVVRGDNRGKSLGFPTINVDCRDLITPKNGVYAVLVKIKGDKIIYKAVANIGIKPTFKGTEKTIEVHIFDFNKDIYSFNVEIEFIKYIRAEQKFESAEKLIKQIEIDCKKAKEILV